MAGYGLLRRLEGILSNYIAKSPGYLYWKKKVLEEVNVRRMNGVVRPHAMLTRRNPRVQRRTEGLAPGAGVSGSILTRW